MKTIHLLAFALFLPTLPASAAAFAGSVVAYDPGTGFATEFGSGLGYTNSGVALGPPNPQTAFGAVMPFNPPFSRDEIVSLGTNGSLVVRFGAPLLNDPSHPFGLDFIIYGSTGFIDTDFPNGHTDGSASVFGNNPGLTRVSVSAGDGIFYTLNPLLAPTVDAFFPTDGEGMFGQPVNPALQPADFANRSLADIRALYAGSAGGAGYDLSWALDANGQPVNLSSISLVRIDVLSGRAEIDGFAAVPEPATWTEDFASDPAGRGWRRFGDASLFRWIAGSQALEVTWDSAKPNSYFYRPLGSILAKNDDFALRFDLRLDSIQAGANPDKPSTFQIAAGFFNLSAATNASFSRGTGHDSPNLVEFDYFPAADFIAATVSPAMVSSNSQFATSFTFPLEMTTGDDFHIELAYSASNHTLVTTMTRNGSTFGPIQPVTLAAGFTDFHVDAIAIASYHDGGDAFGSVLARGKVDNLSVTLPPPPILDLTASVTNLVARVEFTARTNWIYALERTADFAEWEAVPSARPGTAGRMTLSDTNASARPHGFYRVRAHRP